MMNQEKARAIFIEYLTKPDFDRVYFLIEKEEESKRPPEVFARYMLEAFNFYNDTLNYGFQQFKSWGNAPLDYPILLKHESGGQIIFIHLYLSQMSYHYEGIMEYQKIRCSNKKEPAKPKRGPSERERQALYYYYMSTYPKHGEPLYKETLEWEKDSYRLHANGSKKSLNTKKGHMEAVAKRVQSEKQQGWKRIYDRIKQDISTLEENFNKKIPV